MQDAPSASFLSLLLRHRPTVPSSSSRISRQNHGLTNMRGQPINGMDRCPLRWSIARARRDKRRVKIA